MKNLAIFVLDDPTRLISLNSGLQALIASGIRIQAWCRAEDFDALRVLPAGLELHAIDPRLWQADGLRPWWVSCFGPAVTIAQDHVLILDEAFSWTTEKIVLLFPGVRQSIWIKEDRDVAALPEAGESICLVNRVEQVARRLGLPPELVAANALDGAPHAAAALDFIGSTSFGAGAYMVCDLDDLAADAAQAEALAAIVAAANTADAEARAAQAEPPPAAQAEIPPAEQAEIPAAQAGDPTAEAGSAPVAAPNPVQPGPLLRLVVQHDGRPETDPAAFCRALGERGIATLPVNRNAVPWPVRIGLHYLSAGYFGVTGSACDAASAIGRPIVALHGGRAWRELLPHAQWGLCLGCDLPQQGQKRHVAGAIPKADIQQALLQICTQWQTPFVAVSVHPDGTSASTDFAPRAETSVDAVAASHAAEFARRLAQVVPATLPP